MDQVSSYSWNFLSAKARLIKFRFTPPTFLSSFSLVAVVNRRISDFLIISCTSLYSSSPIHFAGEFSTWYYPPLMRATIFPARNVVTECLRLNLGNFPSMQSSTATNWRSGIPSVQRRGAYVSSYNTFALKPIQVLYARNARRQLLSKLLTITGKRVWVVAAHTTLSRPTLDRILKPSNPSITSQRGNLFFSQFQPDLLNLKFYIRLYDKILNLHWFTFADSSSTAIDFDVQSVMKGLDHFYRQFVTSTQQTLPFFLESITALGHRSFLTDTNYVTQSPFHKSIYSSRVKKLFQYEFEDYLVQLQKGRLFSAREFEPIQARYASSYLTNITNKFFAFQFNAVAITAVSFDFYRKLSFSEIVLLRDFAARLILFSAQFSTIFFLSEFIDVVYFSLKLKSLTIIFDYIQRVLKKLLIWDHKKFLLFLFNLFREQMYPLFEFLNIQGLRILIKGKIGVGGNSRKRSMTLVLGRTGATTLYANAHIMNRLLTTTTGALGFRVWLLYRS